MCLKYLYLVRVLFLNFGIKWNHIINIYSSELLCIKIKDSRIIEHKNIFFLKNLHFLRNNILTKLFKELKKTIRMTIIIFKLYM